MYNNQAAKISNMPGDNSDKKTEANKPHRKSEVAPASDSKLSAVQREARSLYQPGSFESAEHAALSESAEAVSIKAKLQDASIGLKMINDYRGDFERSITGGARYVLGAEFAIVAIVALAGVAKRRADLSDASLPAFSGQFDHGLEKRGDRLKELTGYNRDVPDWMISLDNSVAKEAGYLFGSVLRRPTVLITLSDTFVSLAEQHFLDATLSWLIADLNKHKLTEMWKGTTKVVAILNGESIELPVWEDVVEFYQNKPKIARADNLLTVVLKRNLDRELLEATLASVIVPGDANVDEGH